MSGASTAGHRGAMYVLPGAHHQYCAGVCRFMRTAISAATPQASSVDFPSFGWKADDGIREPGKDHSAFGESVSRSISRYSTVSRDPQKAHTSTLCVCVFI